MAKRRRLRIVHRGRFQACIGDKLRGRKFGSRAAARKAFKSAVINCK